MKKKTVSLLLAGVMLLGTSATAMAATVPEDNPAAAERELDGQGYIAEQDEYTDKDPDENGPNTGGMVDVTVPAHGFLWYANEDTAVDSTGKYRGDSGFDDTQIAKYEIRSAKYEIKNNSDSLNLQVTLRDYSEVGTGTIDTTEKALITDLTLLGDLADASISDLLNIGVPADGIVYDSLLSAGSEWAYSFTGTYASAALPAAAKTSNYQMVLDLEVVAK